MSNLTLLSARHAAAAVAAATAATGTAAGGNGVGRVAGLQRPLPLQAPTFCARAPAEVGMPVPPWALSPDLTLAPIYVAGSTAELAQSAPAMAWNATRGGPDPRGDAAISGRNGSGSGNGTGAGAGTGGGVGTSPRSAYTPPVLLLAASAAWPAGLTGVVLQRDALLSGPVIPPPPGALPFTVAHAGGAAAVRLDTGGRVDVFVPPPQERYRTTPSGVQPSPVHRFGLLPTLVSALHTTLPPHFTAPPPHNPHLTPVRQPVP
jgi:hypothetical protein